MTRALEILEPGLMTTVQDSGRYGLGSWGVPAAGALDAEALAMANLLVGNREGAAALEITFTGPVLKARGAVEIAVAGGAFGPSPGRVLRLEDGGTVALTPGAGAARAIVSVAGGIDVPLVLGSRSTSFAAGFGGFEGRRLQRGDVVPLGIASGLPLSRPAPPDLRGVDEQEVFVRVLPGPQQGLFSDEARGVFFSSPYRLLPESNRIGFRLSGPKVAAVGGAGELPSEGTALGSVQVPADGQPIVLLSERPATGGYAKIGTVIAVDLSRFVRARPGSLVRFAPTTVDEARRLFFERRERMRRWREEP
jgi:antagonist of KipI